MEYPGCCGVVPTPTSAKSILISFIREIFEGYKVDIGCLPCSITDGLVTRYGYKYGVGSGGVFCRSLEFGVWMRMYDLSPRCEKETRDVIPSCRKD